MTLGRTTVYTGKQILWVFSPLIVFENSSAPVTCLPVVTELPDVSNTKKDALFGRHFQGAAGKTRWRVQEVPGHVAPTVRELRVVNTGTQLLPLPLYSVGAQPTPRGCHTQDTLAHLNKLV